MQSIHAPHFNYVVPIFNPDQKNRHVTKIWHSVEEKFNHAHELKAKLIADFDDKLPPLIDLECGYMEKTSKRLIEDDQDQEVTYRNLNSGSEITIRCEGQSYEQPSSESSSKNSRKHKAPESDDAPPTKQADKTDQLALEKHEEVYAMPHLRIWARIRIILPSTP